MRLVLRRPVRQKQHEGHVPGSRVRSASAPGSGAWQQINGASQRGDRPCTTTPLRHPADIASRPVDVARCDGEGDEASRRRPRHERAGLMGERRLVSGEVLEGVVLRPPGLACACWRGGTRWRLAPRVIVLREGQEWRSLFSRLPDPDKARRPFLQTRGRARFYIPLGFSHHGPLPFAFRLPRLARRRISSTYLTWPQPVRHPARVPTYTMMSHAYHPLVSRAARGTPSTSELMH